MGKRRQDSFGKRARAEGFAARSVYKLEEIDKRTSLLRRGMRVLDLGAFPGSWLQYAAAKVGPSGYVLGVDLTEFRGALPKQAEFRQGDVMELELEEGMKPFDLVMSDMAPNTTGQRTLDQYRSYELVVAALGVAERVLKPDGNFVAKIFQGPDFENARDQTRAQYKKVRIIKPKATRSESFEAFIVGLGKRHGAAPPSKSEGEVEPQAGVAWRVNVHPSRPDRNPYLPPWLERYGADVWENLDSVPALDGGLPIEILQGFVSQACHSQNAANIEMGRYGILSIPKDWVLLHIGPVVASTLELDDEWESRRLLELYSLLDPGLLRELVTQLRGSANSEIRESAEEFAQGT